MYRISYGKGVKSLSLIAFRKQFEKTEPFCWFDDKRWEKEYETATGKKVENDNTGTGAENTGVQSDGNVKPISKGKRKPLARN